MRIGLRKKVIFLLVLVLLVPGILSAQTEKMYIAVSPFENIGPDEADDYLGFQASVFLSSALASFDNITVVDRQNLEAVLSEQKLQLSGLTDERSAAAIGRLTNARQLLVGTFSQSSSRIFLTARLVDVETGTVLSSGTVEGPQSESYTGLYRALLFELMSNLPQYEVTIPVEAQLNSIEQEAREASENYARALSALFNNKQDEALKYLQRSVGSSEIDFVRFNEMAKQYSEVLESVSGGQFYAKLLQDQIEHNRRLTANLEPLTRYRSTLKVLSDRVDALLAPENFTIEAEIPSQDTWRAEGVSVRIPLPAEILISLNQQTQKRIANLFDEQDIAQLTSREIRLKAAPSVALLPDAVLPDLFALGWQARAAYLVEFLDTSGKVMFSLRGQNLPVVDLGPHSKQFQAGGKTVYTVARPADGWQLRSDGELELQARVLQKFKNVRVVIDPESFELDSGFILHSDDHWEGLINHAYRKKSIKMAISDETDTAPAFKDVVISDTWFSVGNDELDPIPILPRDNKIAVFARPRAFVYFSDNAEGTLTGEWNNDIPGGSYTQSFSSGDVLDFWYPRERTEPYLSSPLRFTARFSASEKTVSVQPLLGEPFDFATLFRNLNADSLAVKGDLLYIQDGGVVAAVDLSRKTVLWSKKILSRYTFYSSDKEGTLHISDDYLFFGISAALDRATGEVLWEKVRHGDRRDQFLHISEMDIIVHQRGSNVTAVDMLTGEEIWTWEGRYLSLSYDSGFLFIKSGRNELFVLNPRTGETIHTETFSFPNGGEEGFLGPICASDGMLFVTAYAWKDTGSSLSNSNSSGENTRITAFDFSDDVTNLKLMWQQGLMEQEKRTWSNYGYNPKKGWVNGFHVYGDRIFVFEKDHFYPLNMHTGQRYWDVDIDINSIKVGGGFIFAGNSGIYSVNKGDYIGSYLATYPSILHLSDQQIFSPTKVFNLGALPPLATYVNLEARQKPAPPEESKPKGATGVPAADSGKGGDSGSPAPSN